MDLKINNVDHRSPYTGFPFTPLSVLVSVSTVSVAGSLLLGESPAYSYSATTAIEDCQQVATNHLTTAEHSNNQSSIQPNIQSTIQSNTQNSAANSESESSAFTVSDSRLDVATVDSRELIQDTNIRNNSGTESDSINYGFIDPVALNQEQVQLTSSNVDLVQRFDTIAAQSAVPFIEISIDDKDVRANPTTPELDPETASEIAQSPAPTEEIAPSASSRRADDLGEPLVTVQGVYLLEGDDSSARARLSASYALTPNVLFGTTLDLTTGNAFTDSPEDGFDLNELYVTVSPPTVPSLRLTLGMIDLTSYFDRNSFAKDAATHFFNPVFQTNPALAAAGIGSRPGALVNWDITDNLSIRGAAFSSDRDLDQFAFDAAAAEVALRLGNFIVRGTYVTDRDAGQDSGFNEIFQFRRGDDDFGLESDDREVAYGVNAEYFIPEINLGLFARYGRYENQDLDRGGNTYSVGLNALDLFFADDRLGLAYGRELSNEGLRRDRGDDIPDVLELFYDVRVLRNFRVGVSLQQRDGFSETVAGLRVRADFNLSELWR